MGVEHGGLLASPDHSATRGHDGLRPSLIAVADVVCRLLADPT